MDADLEERQRMIDEEYRAEALRVVKGGGYFSGRLADLLDEQDALIDEQFLRDNRRLSIKVALVIAVLVGTWLFFMILSHSEGMR